MGCWDGTGHLVGAGMGRWYAGTGRWDGTLGRDAGTGRWDGTLGVGGWERYESDLSQKKVRRDGIAGT
jgi:hypothetical protein